MLELLYWSCIVLFVLKLLMNLTLPYGLVKSGASVSIGLPLLVDILLWAVATGLAWVLGPAESFFSAPFVALWCGVLVLATYGHYFVVMGLSAWRKHRPR